MPEPDPPERVVQAEKIGIVGDYARVEHMHIHEAAELAPPALAPPAERRPLVGRAEVVEDLKRRLMGGPEESAVTVIHLPGVGKRALALHLAYDKQILEHFCDGVLWASLGPQPDLLGTLGLWGSALGISVDEMSLLTTTSSRCDAVRARIGMQTKMFIVVEDVWSAADAGYFLLGGPASAHLVTTRFPMVADELLDAVPSTELLRELSDEDAMELLSGYAPKMIAAEPEAAAELVRKLGGLPLAIVLTGKRLAREERGGDPSRWKGALAKMAEQAPGEPSANPLWAAIRLTEEALPSDEHRRWFRALSIFRPKPFGFSAQAAMAICGIPEESLAELLDYGLVEPAGDGAYQMHRSVDEYAESGLPAPEARALHEKAASYYGGLVGGYEARPGVGAYERWYRYEDPAWGEVKSAWLFHLAHTPDRDEALLQLVTVYLDALWWWGAYVEFPFCERWLADWKRTQSSGVDAPWVQVLEDLHRSYAPQKGARKSDWAAAEKALLEIRKLAGLQEGSGGLSPEKTHLKALTSLFLAEAYRARNPNDSRIDAAYEEAVALVRAAGDDWILAWALARLVGVRCARGEAEAALSLCAECLALARGPAIGGGDRELLSTIHALRAQAEEQLGRWNEAAANWRKAAVYCFVFQVLPNGPDPYTAAFFEDTAALISDRWNKVKELAGFPHPMQDLPDGPGEDDLRHPHSYADAHRGLAQNLLAEVEADQAAGV